MTIGGETKHTYKRLKNGYNTLGAPKLLDVCGVVLSYVAVYNKPIIGFLARGAFRAPASAVARSLAVGSLGRAVVGRLGKLAVEQETAAGPGAGVGRLGRTSSPPPGHPGGDR